MNVYRAGMEGLSAAERRRVRRAISRRERLEDQRLADALVRHVDAYLAAPARYEAVNAVVIALAGVVVLVALRIVWSGPWDDVGSVLAFAGLMAGAQVLIGRPLRRSLMVAAKRRQRTTGGSRSGP